MYSRITSIIGTYDMTRVLVVADSLGQADEMQRHLSLHRDSTIKFLYPAGIAHERASHKALLNDCNDVIKEEDVDTVLCLHPQNHLLNALLLKTFPNMKGPSFESVLICLNKYYCKKLYLPGFSLAFETVEMDDTSPDDLVNALEEIGYPAVFMDSLRTNHSLCRLLPRDRLTNVDVDIIRETMAQNLDYWKNLFAEHVNKHKHPNMFETIGLVVEHWQAFEGDVTFHQVECCICDEELVPWAITDLIFNNRITRRSLKYVSIPTTLKENSQHEIWATAGMIAQRMIDYGFNNQFFNMIVLCTPGGVKVADLECGIIANNTALYRHVLNQGDNVKASIELGMGQTAYEPKINAQHHSIRAELRTFTEEPTIVEHVIDLKSAKQFHEVELMVYHNDAEIETDLVNGGMHLANVYLDGKNLDSCLQELYELMGKFIKPRSKLNIKPDKAKTK